MRFLWFVLLLPTLSLAAERDYQDPWCARMGGKTEVPVKGGRVDCLTDRYAVEVDFAPKWKECIAQGRWYGIQTGKIPGCLLIVGPGQEKYVRYVEDYLFGTDVYIRIWTVPK